jgi:hypothetical protein
VEDNKRPKINLQLAVQMATKTVNDLYKAQGYDLDDLLLEEVQRSGDE